MLAVCQRMDTVERQAIRPTPHDHIAVQLSNGGATALARTRTSFAKGNTLGFKPGQSGNPRARSDRTDSMGLRAFHRRGVM